MSGRRPKQRSASPQPRNNPRPAASNRSHRGDAVIKDVLAATREELVRAGYRALRIEDVAARANVNRTTIYRRWPSKVDLVRDTLRMMFAAPEPTIDTGALRGDLLLVASEMLKFLLSANGRVFVRIVMAEGSDEELRGIVDAMRREKDLVIERILDRARARGEVRQFPVGVFVASLVGGLQHRIFVLGAPIEEIDLEEHVDALLQGVAVRK
jgi:AcrR family transcriptional regulator